MGVYLYPTVLRGQAEVTMDAETYQHLLNEQMGAFGRRLGDLAVGEIARIDHRMLEIHVGHCVCAK